MMPWSTPLWLLPQPPTLPHFNSLLPTPDAPLENSSEITANMLLLSTTICPNKPLPTDRCLFYWEDHQEEKPIQVMCFIYIPDFSKERPRWTRTMVLDHSLLYQSLKLKQVMSQLIFQLTSFLLLMVRFSWKLNCSTRVSDQPSMSVFPSQESDLLLRSRLLNKLPVDLSWNSPNTEKSLPSLNSGIYLFIYFFYLSLYKYIIIYKYYFYFLKYYLIYN